ncbi:MAG: uroporphyrinogen decarboxylase family protein [Bacteroidota bacterium]
MTPRERMKTAMDLGIPDRVPVMCQLSVGHMILQLGVSPVEFWYDGDIFAVGLIRLREIYHFDGILVSLHGHDPNWREKIRSREKTSDGEIVTLADGSRMIHPPNDLPRPSTPSRKDPAALHDPVLPTNLDYIPVSQGLRFLINTTTRFDIFKTIRQKAGSEFSIHGEVTSPFDYYLDLVGHEQGLVGLLESPDRAVQILSHYGHLVSRLASEMCDAGVDAIKISSPFAGASFISPEMYRTFVIPCEAEIAKAVRQKNVHVYLHTCGSISDRLELMFASGVSGIECLDPPPLGNVELEEAKMRLRGRGFIKGNIDSVNTLLAKGSVEILADARKRIEIGKQHGGYILSTACSVAPGVERGKLRLLREAVELWG